MENTLGEIKSQSEICYSSTDSLQNSDNKDNDDDVSTKMIRPKARMDINANTQMEKFDADEDDNENDVDENDKDNEDDDCRDGDFRASNTQMDNSDDVSEDENDEFEDDNDDDPDNCEDDNMPESIKSIYTKGRLPKRFKFFTSPTAASSKFFFQDAAKSSKNINEKSPNRKTLSSTEMTSNESYRFLMNYGNTCFISYEMQAILHLEPFKIICCKITLILPVIKL
jgi:hypothetical protein